MVDVSEVFSGFDVDTGLRLRKIEAQVDLTDLAAKFKNIGFDIPAGAVFVGVQAKILKTVVAGGTTVKIAVGENGGDVDLYGKTADLLVGHSISGGATHELSAFGTYNAGALSLDVCGVVADGSALGDTNISAGVVLVTAYYFELVAL